MVKSVNIPETTTTVDFFIHDMGGHEVFQEYLTKNVGLFYLVQRVTFVHDCF